MGKPTLWAFSLLGGILLTLFGGEAFSQETKESTGEPASPDQQPEKPPRSSASGIGVLEIPRPDGGKDKIYYSTMTPEEEARNVKEEKEKEDRSWEMLNNLVIDKWRK